MRLSQARFQQKQLQEKEQKLLQLYDQQQQRAYQVVQRGSPGSNGSNHATTTITSHQHTSVTKSSSSSHATSTSQGGKVSDSSRGNAFSRYAFFNGLMAGVSGSPFPDAFFSWVNHAFPRFSSIPLSLSSQIFLRKTLFKSFWLLFSLRIKHFISRY